MTDGHYKDLCRHAQATLFALILICTFSLINLGINDRDALSRDASIQIPIVSVFVSYPGFLIFAPLLIVTIFGYLYMVVRRLRIDVSINGNRDVFLLLLGEDTGSRLLSSLLYIFVPSLLWLFAWRAAPRAEGSILAAIAAITSAVTFLVILREQCCLMLQPLKAIAMAGCGTLGVLLALYSGFGIYMTVVGHQHAIFLPSRSVQLYGASLRARDLSDLNLQNGDFRFSDLQEATLQEADLRGADLRYANLSKSILVGADLENADLRDANLATANLKEANLRNAKINDGTTLDKKWQLVWDLVNAHDVRSLVETCCTHDRREMRPEMTWTDLRAQICAALS